MKKTVLGFILAIVVFGQTGATPQPVKAPAYTQARLELITHKWQKVLRLQDWDAVIFQVELKEMKEGAEAYSEDDSRYRWEKIYVLTPAGYDDLKAKEGLPRMKNAEKLADVEDSILHELVHLRLRDLTRMYEPKDLDEDRLLSFGEEVVVVRITSALLHHGELR